MAKSEMAKHILLKMQNIFDIWCGKTWTPSGNVLKKPWGYPSGRKISYQIGKQKLQTDIFFPLQDLP
jgi:hypothetical protein